MQVLMDTQLIKFTEGVVKMDGRSSRMEIEDILYSYQGRIPRWVAPTQERVNCSHGHCLKQVSRRTDRVENYLMILLTAS